MSGGSLWTFRVGHWSSSAKSNSHVAVWGSPHAGSVIVVVKSHVPCCRPVSIIAVGETSVLVSYISWILVIEIASIFCPHPMSIPTRCGPGHEPHKKKLFEKEHKLIEMNCKAVPPRGDYVAVTWTALVSLVLCLRAIRNNLSPGSAFPLYCLLFHMCPEARQSTNTIHGGII